MNDSNMRNLTKVSTTRRELSPRDAEIHAEHQSDFGSESDIVSFWLLLLFVAVFFGIAAEEAQVPFFSSAHTSIQATQMPTTFSEIRNAAARDFDLTSRSRSEKTEVPATGK